VDSHTKRLYRMKAEIIKAAAHPIRLAIIDCLQKRERCVCEITERVDAERSNVSRHLAVMTKAGILDSRKDGLMVYYHLRTPCILKFFSCVEDILREQLAQDARTLRRL